MFSARKQRRLSDLCEVTSSKRIFAADYLPEGVPFYRGKEITEKYNGCIEVSTELFIARSKFEEIRVKSGLPKPGDLLLTSVGTLGSTYVVRRGDEFYFKDGNITWFRNFNGLDSTYFNYWLSAPDGRAELKKCTIGSSQSAYTIILLKGMEIDLPSLQEQRRIASILSAYDDLIENNTRRIAILEEMARRLYEEWFVRFRFPGHEGVPMVESGSDLGFAPEGWNVVPLETQYKTASGGTPSREHPEYFGGDIKWVKTKELNDGFIFTTEESISGSGLSNSSAKVFDKNTLLIAMYGATIGRLGILSTPAATNQACCAVIPVNSDFSLAYAYLTLLTRRQELIDLRTGAAQQNINQITIRKFPLLSPPLNILAAFNSIVQPMLRLSENLQSRNTNLRTTRGLLLPKLISGELDVSTLPEPQAQTT